MSLIRLGKMKLRWCDNCNLPLIGKKCSICGSQGRQVRMTPPGDVRPAFEYDLRMIREITDRQFGKGTGELLLPEDKLALLNRTPAEDRMDEIILDGYVIGALRYDVLSSKFAVSLRVEGAVRILPKLERSWVVVDEGAVAPILGSANALAVGINGIADGIEKGDEVLVLSPGEELIAVGRAMMSSDEMRKADRGVGVKVRTRLKERPEILSGGQTWEDALNANKDALERNISNSVSFLKRTSEKYKLPVIVSYSGGKDSLASLLLALDAGMRPEIMFLNTGIELPETVENARKTAMKYGLELHVVDAKDAFWKGLEVFGPPAKDYRWCCKACKLGPTTLFIKENFPGGMLSIIGQRKYESESRSRKGEEWENPWVKNQKAVSPIQNWTALDVWLYLFLKKADYNPWYERGLYRIGCYLCPSADLGDSRILKENFTGYGRWEEYLENYAENKGLGDEWVEYGLWRWRRAPGWIRAKGVDIPDVARGNGGVSFSGENPIETSVKLDVGRVKRFASILGPWKERDGRIIVEDVCEISENGMDIIDPGSIDAVKGIVEQAVNCIGCGVCVGRCPTGALSIIDGSAFANPETCVHCRECLKGPCPARDFNPADSGKYS